MKKRAQRFGTTGSNTNFMSKTKLAARAARFGIPVKGVDASLLMTDEQKKKRKARFGIVDEEEKMAKRQKRFGNAKSALPPLPSSKAELEKMEKRKARFAAKSS